MILNKVAPWAAAGAIAGGTWYCWFEYLVLGKG
jgi:hypothetical protein